MSRDRVHRRDLMREQLAHHAARLMAEGGITDYAFAKRKAAKQMGAEDTQHLPSNDEVETALRSFRALYQSESHPIVLNQLRRQALDVMQLLEPFHPFLSGSVLSGTASEQSDINLLVYSDDEKAVMMFLLKQNLPFEGSEWSVHLTGRQQSSVPGFTLKPETGVPVNIAVLPANARFNGGRKIGKQADMAAVKKLLDENVSHE